MPALHDAIKIALPTAVHVPIPHVVFEDKFLPPGLAAAPGEKCIVIGYPFGYSSGGPEKTTPVVLTRFLASHSIPGRRRELFIDSIAAPGMSGGPVYVERDDLLLLGMYTGAVYPEQVPRDRESMKIGNRVTDLGAVVDLTRMLSGEWPFVGTPSRVLLPTAT